jgi:hypothetical protein
MSGNPLLSLFRVTIDVFGVEERKVKLNQKNRAMMKG